MLKEKKYLLKFIKEYPRVFAASVLLLFICFLFLPLPLKAKTMIIFRAIVISLLLAVYVKYFWRRNEPRE